MSSVKLTVLWSWLAVAAKVHTETYVFDDFFIFASAGISLGVPVTDPGCGVG
jgi:hypothetical protein